jgi:hypothetical protein
LWQQFRWFEEADLPVNMVYRLEWAQGRVGAGDEGHFLDLLSKRCAGALLLQTFRALLQVEEQSL